MKHATVLLCAVFILIGSANVPAAQSYSELKDAFGYVVGTYTSGLLIAEVCSGYPKLKTESEAASRNYLSANSGTYYAVQKKMQVIAFANGGQSELNRLKKEVKDMLSDQESLKAEIRKTASSENSCRTLLRNLRRGYWDIKTKAHRELELIGLN